ncbi:MAG: uracil-DNA glycosylase [Rhodobacteraceae bacterium]|nr:uracil-DNA glycosylase [Paracoccaceae bacterium]
MMLSKPDLPGWNDLPFWQDEFGKIQQRLAEDDRVILPPAALVFAAFEGLSPDKTRVVILGQDPYPTPGHAHGLAFSVTPGTKLPRSLSNIYKEMQSDIDVTPSNGDLHHWAEQGVLLLNSALTVPAGEADKHAKIGWLSLVTQVLERLSTQPTCFILWGKKAQNLFDKVGIFGDHFVLRSAHPSPLSARNGFFGSKPFSQVNHWLEARGEAPIDWAGANSQASLSFVQSPE